MEGYSVNKKGHLSTRLLKTLKTKREDLGSTVKVIYKGKYIIDTDYIFNYGLMKDMPRPKSNLAETRLSYIVYQPNLYKMKSKVFGRSYDSFC